MNTTDNPTRTVADAPLSFASGPAQPDADASLQAANQRITDLTAEIAKLTEQITDGSDPRLTDFWRNAMHIADERGFCEEFDIITEAMGGPSRRFVYTVTQTVTVTFTTTQNVTAICEEEAGETARALILDGTVSLPAELRQCASPEIVSITTDSIDFP